MSPPRVPGAVVIALLLPTQVFATLTFHNGQLAGTTAYLSDFFWGTNVLPKGKNLTAEWIDVFNPEFDAPVCSADGRSDLVANFTGKVCYAGKERITKQQCHDEVISLAMQEYGCAALILATSNPDGYSAHGVDDDGEPVGGDFIYWSVGTITETLTIPTLKIRTHMLNPSVDIAWHGNLKVTEDALSEAISNASKAGTPLIVTISRQESSAYADFSNSPLVFAVLALWTAPMLFFGAYMTAIRLWCFAHPPDKKKKPQYFQTPQKILWGEMMVCIVGFLAFVVEMPLGLARGHFTFPVNRFLFTIGNPILATEAVLLAFFWAEMTSNFSGRMVRGLQKMKRPFIGIVSFFFLLDVFFSIGVNFIKSIQSLTMLSALIGCVIMALEAAFFRLYGKKIIGAMGSTMKTGSKKGDRISADESAQAKNLLLMSKRIMLAAIFMIAQIITNLASYFFLWGPPWAILFIVTNAITWNRASGLCLVLCFNPAGTKKLQPSFLNDKRASRNKKRKISSTESSRSQGSSAHTSSVVSSSVGSVNSEVASSTASNSSASGGNSLDSRSGTSSSDTTSTSSVK